MSDTIYTSAEQLIGRTPLLELTRIAREEALEARVLVKLERSSIAGSAKDRAARAMLDDAGRRGVLKEARSRRPLRRIAQISTRNFGGGPVAISRKIQYN